MKVTTGFIMFWGGIAGGVICLFLFVLTGIIFAGQKKRLLEKMQQD